MTAPSCMCLVAQLVLAAVGVSTCFVLACTLKQKHMQECVCASHGTTAATDRISCMSLFHASSTHSLSLSVPPSLSLPLPLFFALSLSVSFSLSLSPCTQTPFALMFFQSAYPKYTFRDECKSVYSDRCVASAILASFKKSQTRTPKTMSSRTGSPKPKPINSNRTRRSIGPTASSEESPHEQVSQDMSQQVWKRIKTNNGLV